MPRAVSHLLTFWLRGSRFFLMEQYIPVLVALVFAGGLATLMVSASSLFGPKRHSLVKDEPFECGNPATGSAWGRFSVKFYLVAILFIVFDIEVVFLYPWAVVFRRLGLFGFVEMLIFVTILTVGLVYIIKKGALESA
jgi:NADH-quinone oxidoreductase subunit A